MNIQFFQKLTLLDYPGKTACTVFTYGCNLRCPFCHNAALVVRPAEESIPEEEFFAFLDKRTKLLDGVCITGGEPLLQKDIHSFIQKIKDKGFSVKLDTNGFFPEKLKSLIDEKLIDYVAMDIKNSPQKYSLTCGIDKADMDKVFASADILINSGIDYEFRTTAVKELHSASDFIDIGKWLQGNSKYYIQCFIDSGDTIGSNFSSPSNEDLNTFKTASLTYLPHTEIRGV